MSSGLFRCVFREMTIFAPHWFDSVMIHLALNALSAISPQLDVFDQRCHPIVS
jgi:hypothetical protein